MFSVDEYVVCGNKGVCVVSEITTLNISGVSKDKEYYILKPVYSPASTVYVPVDASKESIRKISNREEVLKLISDIKTIPVIETESDKLLEQEYKGCMRTNCCGDLMKVLKTIYGRRAKRLQAGRKVTAVDTKYYKMLEDILFGEFALVLGIEKDKVEAVISGEISA